MTLRYRKVIFGSLWSWVYGLYFENFWKLGIVEHVIFSSPGCPSCQEQRFLQSGRVLWVCMWGGGASTLAWTLEAGDWTVSWSQVGEWNLWSLDPSSELSHFTSQEAPSKVDFTLELFGEAREVRKPKPLQCYARSVTQSHFIKEIWGWIIFIVFFCFVFFLSKESGKWFLPCVQVTPCQPDPVDR